MQAADFGFCLLCCQSYNVCILAACTVNSVSYTAVLYNLMTRHWPLCSITVDKTLFDPFFHSCRFCDPVNDLQYPKKLYSLSASSLAPKYG